MAFYFFNFFYEWRAALQSKHFFQLNYFFSVNLEVLTCQNQN